MSRLRHDHAAIIDRGNQWNETGHRPQRSVETQLGEESETIDAFLRDDFLHHQETDGNRQIETGAAPLHRRAHRQVDGDAAVGPWKRARQQCCPHSIAGFATRLVGLTNDGEPRKARANVHFNVDRLTVNAEQRCGPREGKCHARNVWTTNPG